MANFRRKKPRLRTYGKGYDKWRVREIEKRGGYHRWMANWPCWHDLFYHRRPHRRATKAIEIEILRDRVDADDTAWPVAKKPHTYYW